VKPLDIVRMAQILRKNYSVSGYYYASYAEKRVLKLSFLQKTILTLGLIILSPIVKIENLLSPISPEQAIQSTSSVVVMVLIRAN
jgi:hypothetical protein